jgi:hypothetical protein
MHANQSVDTLIFTLSVFLQSNENKKVGVIIMRGLDPKKKLRWRGPILVREPPQINKSANCQR